MAEVDEDEPWEGRKVPHEASGQSLTGQNRFGQYQVPKATDQYIDRMEKDSFGQGEYFNRPKIKEMTDNAKDVVRQIMRNYNAGDPLTRQKVLDFEKNEMRHGSEWQSGQRMNAETAWEIFYHAHQKYLGSRLQDEDNPPSKEDERLYNEQYGFDMGGRELFDFDSLRDAGKLSPKGVK